MGNGQPKYLSSNEAQAIIGPRAWGQIRKQLEQTHGRVIEFDGFDRIIRGRFERMVKLDLLVNPADLLASLF